MPIPHHQSLLILLLSHTFHVISQNNYFIDTYNDANEGIIYVPYPNGHCTLTDNHNSPNYHYYECDSNTNLFYCENNADSICQLNGICLPNSYTASYDPSSISINTLYYGQCPNGLFSVNNNYTKITLYASSKSTNDGCPSSTDFTLFGTTYIATNICTQQLDGSYLMMTCDGFTAQMTIYNDNICTQLNHTLIQYSRLCDYYTDSGISKMYRRFEGCYINNNNQLQPTPNPTSNPTINPTVSPTINPTYIPTSNPSIHPTYFPTLEPTIYPTYNPSILPTINPTIYPSVPPTTSKPANTLPQTASVISDLNNITLLYIIFAVLFVFYIFICFYIWCNERRRRKYLTSNFQKGNDIDREARIQYNQQNGNIEHIGYDIDPYQINGDGGAAELDQFNANKNNVVFLDDDDNAHRAALMNEGYVE